MPFHSSSAFFLCPSVVLLSPGQCCVCLMRPGGYTSRVSRSMMHRDLKSQERHSFRSRSVVDEMKNRLIIIFLLRMTILWSILIA